MRNRLVKTSILSIEMILFYFIFSFKPECLINKYFHIKCGTCGMTRAFIEILKCNFVGAIKYNVLSPIVFIFLVLVTALLILDLIFDKKSVEVILKKVGRYYILIIIVYLINMIYNNL